MTVSAVDAAASEEDRLDRAPMIAARRLGAGQLQSVGVRPNFPAITISVLSSNPINDKSSSAAPPGLVGEQDYSWSGKAASWVSQVSLLPRLTCTKRTPASTRSRPSRQYQPNRLRP